MRLISDNGTSRWVKEFATHAFPVEIQLHHTVSGLLKDPIKSRAKSLSSMWYVSVYEYNNL